MLGLGSGLLPVNGISPMIPTLFLSLIFLYSFAAPLPQVGSLLGWSQHKTFKPMFFFSGRLLYRDVCLLDPKVYFNLLVIVSVSLNHSLSTYHLTDEVQV